MAGSADEGPGMWPGIISTTNACARPYPGPAQATECWVIPHGLPCGTIPEIEYIELITENSHPLSV